MEGWIKLHRKILENPICWKDSDYLAVWVYLLLNATHKNYNVIFKGKKTTLTPGQLLTGRQSISKFTKINESKVQRILKMLENEQQIEQQTTPQNRLITILSWLDYQDNEQQNEQQLNNKRTTNEHKQECKNVKNEKIKTDNNVFSFYENNIGLITPHIAEQILFLLDEQVEENLIIRCLQLGLEKNIRNWSYAKKIIDNCKKQNIKTLDEFNSNDKPKNNFKNDKNAKRLEIDDFLKELGG
jgi:DnaD/phage-associated family protein